MKEETKSWLLFAESDIVAARNLLQNRVVPNVILFHCHQCIEKSIKAVLAQNNIEIPRIHGVLRLNEIMSKLIKYHSILTNEELNEIDDIYIDTRYPGTTGILPGGNPDLKDAEYFYKLAEKFYMDINKLLGI